MMGRYLIQRLIQAVPTFFGVTIIVFALINAVPGGPGAELALDPTIKPEDLARIRSLVSIGAQLAIPLIAKAAIDGTIHDGNKRGLLPLLVLAVVLGLFELSLTYRRRLALGGDRRWKHCGERGPGRGRSDCC